MQTQPELVLTSPVSPEAAIADIYQCLGIRRRNWKAIWNECTEDQRQAACRAGGLSQVIAAETWERMRECDKDRIRAAFRARWAERRVQ